MDSSHRGSLPAARILWETVSKALPGLAKERLSPLSGQAITHSGSLPNCKQAVENVFLYFVVQALEFMSLGSCAIKNIPPLPSIMSAGDGGGVQYRHRNR